MPSAIVAPWLHPLDFVKAMSEGAQAGIHSRAVDNEAIQAGDRLRLAYDQLNANEQREQEAEANKMELAKASMALRSQQMDALEQYRQDQTQARNDALDETKGFHTGELASRDASRALREKLANERFARDYGAPQFMDVPGIPGAKYAFRGGSTGGHVIMPVRPASTATLDLKRLAIQKGLATEIAKANDIADKTSPEYQAATNYIAQAQNYLKGGTIAPGAAAGPSAAAGPVATHRFNPTTGKIEAIGVPVPVSAGAALISAPHDETDSGLDDEEDQ